MRKPSVLLAVVTLAACGSGNDVGFTALGSLDATASSPTGGQLTRTGFRFDQTTRIDPTLPAGDSAGFTGQCQVGPDARRVTIRRLPSDGFALNEATITLPSWDACGTDCHDGQIAATLGTVAFTGSRAGATSAANCSFTATRHGSYGMELAVQCAALHAEGDARTVAINAQLTLNECDGPETR